MIAEIEAERDAIVKEAAPQHLNADKIKALVRLKSIGWSSPHAGRRGAVSILRQPPPARSYVGLTPSPYSSGSTDRDQGISKAGNPKAPFDHDRTGLDVLRHQPDSTLSIWFRKRVGDLKGRPRRIAIVAFRTQAPVALWRYLETGLVPAGACSRRADRPAAPTPPSTQEDDNQEDSPFQGGMLTVARHG